MPPCKVRGVSSANTCPQPITLARPLFSLALAPALSPDPSVTPSKVQGIVRRMSASLSRPREDEGFTHIIHCTEESDVPARGGGGVTFSRSGAVARVLELAQLNTS